jgi:hypothetical protein
VQQIPSCKTIDFSFEEVGTLRDSCRYQIVDIRDQEPARVPARVRFPYLLEQEYPVGQGPEFFLLPRTVCTWQYPMTYHCLPQLEEVGVLFSFFLEAGQ